MKVGLCISRLAKGTLEKNVSTRWNKTGGGGMLSGQTVVEISKDPGLPSSMGARGSIRWSGSVGGLRISHGEGGKKKPPIADPDVNIKAVVGPSETSKVGAGGFSGLGNAEGLAAELESPSVGDVPSVPDGSEKTFAECAAPQVHFANTSLVA